LPSTCVGRNPSSTILCPQDQFKLALPVLSNCMVVGDQKKFLTVLFTFKTQPDEQGNPTNLLTKEVEEVGRGLGSTATTVEQAAADPLVSEDTAQAGGMGPLSGLSWQWKKYLDDGLKMANSKATSSAQIVQKWSVLPLDFSEKGGELTPTLKLKRSVVAGKYANVIESLYTGGEA
jgi:long-chain-fatty-acid--CoA ligase ACSBG